MAIVNTGAVRIPHNHRARVNLEPESSGGPQRRVKYDQNHPPMSSQKVSRRSDNSGGAAVVAHKKPIRRLQSPLILTSWKAL
jgi:hypothetical protein